MPIILRVSAECFLYLSCHHQSNFPPYSNLTLAKTHSHTMYHRWTNALIVSVVFGALSLYLSLITLKLCWSSNLDTGVAKIKKVQVRSVEVGDVCSIQGQRCECFGCLFGSLRSADLRIRLSRVDCPSSSTLVSYTSLPSVASFSMLRLIIYDRQLPLLITTYFS